MGERKPLGAGRGVSEEEDSALAIGLDRRGRVALVREGRGAGSGSARWFCGGRRG